MCKSGVYATVAVVCLFCVFSVVTSAQTTAKLHDCLGDCGPSELILGSDGNLYGAAGDIGNHGAVFQMTPSGAATVLYKFNGSDGEYPNSPLAQGADGNLYGTTYQEGGNGVGTVFRLTTAGVLTTLYTFCSFPHCWDGSRPVGGLTLGTDGNLYGVTAFGGHSDYGTIFRITPSGDLLTLYEFTGPDGIGPGHLIQGSDNNFWGITRGGGASGAGTVFKITASGTLTVMHSFQHSDGSAPNPLVEANGSFWGTTQQGGNYDGGTAFKINPAGIFTPLHNFNGSEGSWPASALTPVVDGLHNWIDFYGTTQYGGAHNKGTIFKMGVNGAVTSVHDFNGTDGWATNGFLRLPNGNLYSSMNGGTYGNGAVVVVSPIPYELVNVTPCRLLDTRKSSHIIGGTIQSFDLRQLAQQNGCADLSTADNYSLNVTLVPVNYHPVGYLTIWPFGMSRPVVSTMNSLDGRIKANAAIVPAGTNGRINIYVTDTTDVVLDINGYFALPDPGNHTLQFYPVTPCRVADTRKVLPYGLGQPHLSAGEERNLAINLSGCLPAGATAGAYSFNFTVVPYPSGHPLGYLEVWPTLNKPSHPVSTLNNLTATLVANAAIVPAGYLGHITVMADSDTDLVVDMNGYFALPADSGLALYPAAPCRVFDTRRDRDKKPLNGVLLPPLDVVNSACGIPRVAKAYGFNATVVPSPTLGYLTLWPNGQEQPIVSTLNAPDGWITSNMAIVPSNDGFIEALAAGTAHLILDVASYFAP